MWEGILDAEINRLALQFVSCTYYLLRVQVHEQRTERKERSIFTIFLKNSVSVLILITEIIVQIVTSLDDD